MQEWIFFQNFTNLPLRAKDPHQKANEAEVVPPHPFLLNHSCEPYDGLKGSKLVQLKIFEVTYQLKIIPLKTIILREEVKRRILDKKLSNKPKILRDQSI